LSLSRTQEKLDFALDQNQILERKLVESEEKLKKYESNSIDSTKFESLIGSKDSEIQKLKHDISSLQSHLSEAMRRLKSGLNSDIVDKKLISNLFVQFLSLSRGDSKKFEILDVISGILDLSKSDKVKIGLLHDKIESPQESTFTDMWISFLYKEAGVFNEGQ
jgi:predicted RNase H-like nuclease (RuvC/YqgF family)